jgi:outer membrane receptor protein involved in Fe transport
LDFKTNINYNISDKLVSSTVIGAQSFNEFTNQQQVSVNNFPSAALSTLRGGSSVSNVDEYEETVINAGVFVQEQLAYNDRLFLTLGMRMDGNSAFGEDFGFESYPKAGLSWVISEEPFWNFGAINQMRIRAAFGTSGLQPGAFDAQRTWQPSSGIENNQAVLPLNLGNKDLKPERSQEVEFGAEFTAFNDLLGVEIVYYNQKTTDALLPVSLSPSLGFLQSQLTNIGGMESKGLELSGNWTVFKKNAVSVKLSGSYSKIDQTVTDMAGVPPFRIEGRRRWSQIKEGYQPGAIIAPVHDPNNPWSTSVPIDQVTHRSQIYPNFKKDANGDDALEYIGNSSPTYTFSFGTTVKFSKNLSLRAMFRGEGDFLISRESELIRQNLGYNKVAADLAFALDPANNVALEERKKHIEAYGMRHPNVFSDWMESGDYTKFQELALIWQVPGDVASRFGFTAATVSFNARNLHIFTDFGGYIDPGGGRGSRSEFLQNIDYMSGPSPIFYGVSINTTF